MRTLRASILLFVLSGSAYAGDIPYGKPAPPPSQPATIEQEPTNTTQEPAADGDMQNGVTDGLTETVLDLFAGVLALV